MSPAQARRVGELWLINCFTATLWLHSLADRPCRDSDDDARFWRTAISKKEAAAMVEDDEGDAENDGRAPTIAMLLAATRWVLASISEGPPGAPLPL
jgi:hypothetical protein